MKIKISSLDRMFSNWLRAEKNYTCERCLRRHSPPTQAIHVSHFWGRAKKITRFDPENCAVLCFGCHQHFTAHPHEHREWFLKRLGEKKYNALMLRANTPKKPDYEMIRLWLKNVCTEKDNDKSSNDISTRKILRQSEAS